MQEFQDNFFDETIARAMKSDPMPSPAQQQRVRESLCAKAEQQTMLVPLSPTLFERLSNSARLWGKSQIANLYHVFLDDSAYRRAPHRYPSMMRHQRPHSTFASAEFMLFA